jgi:hypothetical protein
VRVLRCRCAIHGYNVSLCATPCCRARCRDVVAIMYLGDAPFAVRQLYLCVK